MCRFEYNKDLLYLMSKREYGCFSILFGACGKKKKDNRNAASVKRVAQCMCDEKGTQTQEILSRKSAPPNFPRYYKSTIAVRDSNGFSVQKIKEKSDSKDSGIRSVRALTPLSDTKNDEINENELVNSKSISRLISSISPPPPRDFFQSPFKLDQVSTKPRLIPITPDLLLKKIPHKANPIKPIKKFDNNEDS